MPESVPHQNPVSEANQPGEAPIVPNDAAPPGGPPAAPKKSHLFQPGKSGNPSGRPKRSREERDALEAIRNLAPLAADKVAALLSSDKTPAAVKVRLIEIIFDRTYGKPETSVRVSSVQETVAESRSYILSLVQQVREQALSDGAVDPGLSLPETPAAAPARLLQESAAGGLPPVPVSAKTPPDVAPARLCQDPVPVNLPPESAPAGLSPELPPERIPPDAPPAGLSPEPIPKDLSPTASGKE